MKGMQKIISVALSCLMITFFPWATTLENAKEEIISIDDQIADQILEQVNVPKRNNSQTQIVCLDQVAAYDLDESNSSPTKKALQTVEQNGEDMAVSTYVPYTVDESTGELVNSFAYVASLNERAQNREISSNLVDVILRTTASDTSHAMPHNRAVHMADYFEHGGFVYVKVNYYNRSTGQSKMADATYRIYSKSSQVS